MRLDVAADCASSDPDGRSLLSGFYGTIPLSAALAARTLPIALQFEWRDGTSETRLLGHTTFVEEPEAAQSTPTPTEWPAAQLVICLGTYKPDLEAFRRQVDSIIGQTVEDWICIVNDDHSPPAVFEQIEAVCCRDRRFRVSRNPRNLGFYHNYESALWKARAIAPAFVALADQDDYWYPTKLERCLAGLQDGSMLAYCDMRLTRPSGEVLSNTYWFNRRNNYTDADVIFLANTVTGAASVFRGSLLDKVLPFPGRLGDCFHDHWIACCALAAGQLAYLDEPLYEYVQHGSQVIGHCSFDQRPWTASARAAAAALRSGGTLKEALRSSAFQSQAVYLNEYRRVELFGRILRARFPDMSPQRARAFRLTDGTWASVGRLLAAHARYRVTRATTGDAEIRLAQGYLVTRWLARVVHFARRYLIHRIRRGQGTPRLVST